MNDPSIPLHPEKGVNPHLTICPGCGEDGEEILLLGTSDYIHRCTACNTNQLATKRAKKCPQCGEHALQFVRQLETQEKLPGSLCKKCSDARDVVDAAVKEGGVYWKCKDCNSNGALKAEAQLAKDVRKQMGIKAPKPCGVEFTKENCPVCGVQNGKENSH